MNGMNALRSALVAALGDARVKVLGEAVELSPVTRGLQADFAGQVVQLPAADAALVGVALGMAMNGDTVVVELAGPESVPAALQALDQAESTPHSPLRVVLRVPVAPGAIDQLGVALSSVRENVAVLAVGQAGDAGALLTHALQHAGPTLLVEPLEVLSAAASGADPGDVSAPVVLREGDHASILALGPSVPAALHAADVLASEGIGVDVIDLRGLDAVDAPVLAERMRHTGRPVLAVSVGYGRVLDAVHRHAFLRLEAPPAWAGTSADDLVRSVRTAVHF